MNKTIESKYKTNYIKSFDTLRGIAVLVVVLYHGGYDVSFRGGWLGVDLFFIISGYLITSILKDEYSEYNKINILKFYFSRIVRLFPPLILCIVFSNILWQFSAIPFNAQQLLSTIASIFYFMNFLVPEITGNLGHTWSLSVEEQFYFFWPLLLPFFLKNNIKKASTYLIILLIISTLIRIVVYYYHDLLVGNLFLIDPYRFTFCRLDSILLGALLSLMTYKTNLSITIAPINKAATYVVCTSVVIMMVIFLTLSIKSPLYYYGGFIFTNIFFLGIIYTSIKYQNHPFLNTKIGNWLGKRSYGIYLYHVPVHVYLEQFREHRSARSFIILTILRIGITIIIAAISYQYLEKPFARYRERLKANKSSTL